MKPNKPLPVLFVPHGGGPWPFVRLPLFPEAEAAALKNYFETLLEQLPSKPKSVLILSAHWEEEIPTVLAAPNPSLLYDYYGFPPESYQIQWPAPGDPALASRVRELLEAAGFQTGRNDTRGFDHGVFVPMKLMVPHADIPTLQLSLLRGLDPQRHIDLGKALQPLRKEGVLIVGSGMSYHNLREFGSPQGRESSERFDAWLCQTATAVPEDRNQGLVEWSSAPGAQEAHPRSEHLLPLIAVSGAAGDDRGVAGFNGIFGNARISAFHF